MHPEALNYFKSQKHLKLNQPFFLTGLKSSLASFSHPSIVLTEEHAARPTPKRKTRVTLKPLSPKTLKRENPKPQNPESLATPSRNLGAAAGLGLNRLQVMLQTFVLPLHESCLISCGLFFQRLLGQGQGHPHILVLGLGQHIH